MKTINTFLSHFLTFAIVVLLCLVSSDLRKTKARVRTLEITTIEMKRDLNYLGTIVFLMVEPQKPDLGEIK